MNATGAVVFLPREGNGPSLMLEELLFDPAALWLAESLRAAGVERFFVVCHTDDQARAAASFPAGTAAALLKGCMAKLIILSSLVCIT